MKQPNNIIDWSLVLLIGAIWGSSFLFIKILTPVIGPLMLVHLRLLIASMFLAPIFIRKRHLENFKDQLIPIVLLATFNAIFPFYLFSVASLELTAGTLAVLNGITPFFTFIFSVLWLKSVYRFTQLLGIIIGILGLYVFVGHDSLNFALAPVFLCLFASSMYAFGTNYLSILKNLEPTYIATMTLLAGAVLTSPVMFIDTGYSFEWNSKVLMSLFLLGAMCTGLAYVCYVFLIRRSGPVETSTTLLIVPIFGMIWANIFLQEVITITMIIGCGLISGGVFLTHLRVRSRN